MRVWLGAPKLQDLLVLAAAVPKHVGGPSGTGAGYAAGGHTELAASHLLLVQQLLQAGLVLGGLRVCQELQILNPEGL